MINLKHFDSILLKLDKKVVKKHWYLIYWIHHNKN